jgi:hypothetical protein
MLNCCIIRIFDDYVKVLNEWGFCNKSEYEESGHGQQHPKPEKGLDEFLERSWPFWAAGSGNKSAGEAQ